MGTRPAKSRPRVRRRKAMQVTEPLVLDHRSAEAHRVCRVYVVPRLTGGQQRDVVSWCGSRHYLHLQRARAAATLVEKIPAGYQLCFNCECIALQQGLPATPPPESLLKLPAVYRGAIQAPDLPIPVKFWFAMADTSPSVLALLRTFPKRPGLTTYTKDTQKIKLLGQYLSLRRFAPTLTFERFLDVFAETVEEDSPDKIIAISLPRRAKKKGDPEDFQQWAAKDTVKLVAAYLDIARLYAATGQEFSLPLASFLQDKGVIAAFFRGDFEEKQAQSETVAKALPVAPQPEPPEIVKQTAPTGPAAVTLEVVSGKNATTPGDRCTYLLATGRQMRGVLSRVLPEAPDNIARGVFKDDTGEKITGVPLASLYVCHDPLPLPPCDSEGAPLAEILTTTMTIGAAEYSRIEASLSLDMPVGNVSMGKNCWEYSHMYKDGAVAYVRVVNSETGPYVDAVLVDPSQRVFAVEPRKSIEGDYTFSTPDGYYKLIVAGKQFVT